MTRKEFNKSVDLFADGLYRFILKNIRDVEKARDIVQETFTKTWLKVEEIDFDKIKSYLFTTAYRTMIDLIRLDDRFVRPKAIDFENKHTYNNYSDLKEILDRALAQLPEIQRSVVLLRDYEGYSYEEIGEITDLTESQVKVYIFRARKNLKTYLQSIDTVLEINT
ncbi:MAG: RNA polymerase sigma factor [Lentimicrobiaceae bacterium]|jgi:RNA polymerase sigma-70 factor (ECF subfamily)|nr:RNA polymerase sigma factor [Lentimicrobiaceae bacterium]